MDIRKMGLVFRAKRVCPAPAPEFPATPCQRASTRTRTPSYVYMLLNVELKSSKCFCTLLPAEDDTDIARRYFYGYYRVERRAMDATGTPIQQMSLR